MRSTSIAPPVFGLLDVGIHIVVTEVPMLVCADGLEASWADGRLTAFDPASPFLPQTAMSDPIALPLDAVLHQPPPSLGRRLDLDSAYLRVQRPHNTTARIGFRSLIFVKVSCRPETRHR